MQPDPMFSMYDDAAREAVVQARRYAQSLSQDRVGTEHLLAGILQAGGAAADVLRPRGIKMDAVIREVGVPVISGDWETESDIPFTPEAARALGSAPEEARQLKQDHIGTEHLLLGIVRYECTAADLLTGLGAERTAIRDDICRRFLPKESVAPRGTGVFDSFTDRARRVVLRSQDLARELPRDYIGSEHLLLGLLSDDESMGTQVLDSLGVSLEPVRHLVTDMGASSVSVREGYLPMTRQTKDVFVNANREADQLGNSYVGTEHLLLAMLDDDSGGAAQVLIKLGVSLNRVRERTVERMHASGLIGSALYWQFLALPALADALTGFSFTPTGVGSVCFRAPEKRAFRKPEFDIGQMLSVAGEEGARLEPDSYGFTWIILREPPGKFSSLVTRMRTVNLEMKGGSGAGHLLCSVVGFTSPDQGQLEIVFLDRLGTFYPFAPQPGKKRNNELELGFKDMAEQRLPIEADLTKWMALWGVPGQ
jgi:hypothetical protein